MSEIWKDVPGYEGNYRVSSKGKVKSLERNGTLGGILKPDIVYGYEQVVLYKDNKRTPYKIHRLVMLAFVGDSELCVNHKNLNRTDNRLENLEYVTHKQNTKHARELLGNWTPRGQNHGMSKLTRNQVKEIRQLCKSKTQRSVAKQYNLSEAQISRIVNKRRWS